MVRLDDYSSAQPMRQAGRVEFVVGRQGYYIGRKLEENAYLDQYFERFCGYQIRKYLT